MSKTFEAALGSVWKQVMVEKKTSMKLSENSFPVTATSAKRLKQVEFEIAGRRVRGIEQSPATKSRWAKMAKAGKNVMQFIEDGKYVAVVVDGRVRWYRDSRG